MMGRVGLQELFLLFLLFVVAAPLYFLPSYFARKKRNRAAIFALNLLLGWTVAGWILALIWGLTKNPPSSVSTT